MATEARAAFVREYITPSGRLISDALCSTGHYLAAYRILMQQECPSWLYPVTMRATTVWERWDSMLPDGSINPGEMTSFNHYALGAVADWTHRAIGSLTPTEPGYRSIEIYPRPGGGITHAQARHLTPYGMVESAWKIEDGKFDLDVTILPNTNAIVILPWMHYTRRSVRLPSCSDFW